MSARLYDISFQWALKERFDQGVPCYFLSKWKLEIHSRLLCESDQLPESRTSGSERRWFGDGSGGGSWFVKEVIGGRA